MLRMGTATFHLKSAALFLLLCTLLAPAAAAPVSLNRDNFQQKVRDPLLGLADPLVRGDQVTSGCAHVQTEDGNVWFVKFYSPAYDTPTLA